MKLILTSAVISALWLGAIASLPDSKQEPEAIAIVQPIKVVEPDKRVRLAGDWIIRNSNKISDETAYQIAEECFKHQYPILLVSLIEAESEFVPSAVSHKGALGLGQIMYDVHKKDLETLGIMKRKDLFDVKKNVKATSFVLQMMLKKDKGDIVKALHSYLGGKDGKYTNRIFTNYVCLSMELENDKVMPTM